MRKTISKAIMVRSRLKNKYMKNTSKGNQTRKKLICETFEKRKESLLTLIQKITDNKIIWQAVKPFFTEKTLDSDQFTLINKD